MYNYLYIVFSVGGSKTKVCCIFHTAPTAVLFLMHISYIYNVAYNIPCITML